MRERQRNERRDEKGQRGNQHVEIGDGLGGVEGEDVLREAAPDPAFAHGLLFKEDDQQTEKDEHKQGQQQAVDGPGPAPAPFAALQQDGIARKPQPVQPCEDGADGVTGDA